MLLSPSALPSMPYAVAYMWVSCFFCFILPSARYAYNFSLFVSSARSTVHFWLSTSPPIGLGSTGARSRSANIWGKSRSIFRSFLVPGCTAHIALLGGIAYEKRRPQAWYDHLFGPYRTKRNCQRVQGCTEMASHFGYRLTSVSNLDRPRSWPTFRSEKSELLLRANVAPILRLIDQPNR